MVKNYFVKGTTTEFVNEIYLATSDGNIFFMSVFFTHSRFYYLYRSFIIKKISFMKVSTRNNFEGKVKKIEHGSVNSEVVVELPGGQEIVSIITKTSAENLGLAIGKTVYVLIKASNVMLATED